MLKCIYGDCIRYLKNANIYIEKGEDTISAH